VAWCLFEKKTQKREAHQWVANRSVIRRFALGLLKRETSCKRGIETKAAEVRCQ
jgi:hypothetical protein